MEPVNRDDTPYPYMVEDENSPETNPDREQLLDTPGELNKSTIIKPTRCNGCTVYVEPVLFLIMLTQYPMYMLIPQYVLGRELERLTGNASLTINTSACQRPEQNITLFDDNPIRGNYTAAQSAASFFQLQSQLVSAIPALLVVIFMGPYSDKKGRKYAIIPPLIGSSLSTLNCFLNVYFHLPVELLLVGNFIYACSGYWVTLVMGCISFIADITTLEQRQFRLVITEICTFLPSILSAAGSGFWVDSLGYSTYFFLAFVVNIFMLVYAIFVIPETVIPDPDAKLFSTSFVKKAFTVFLVDDKTKRRWKLLTLWVALFFCLLVALGANINTLFMKNYPLCWSAELIGIQTSVNQAVAVIGSTVTAKVFNLFLRDIWIAVIAGVMDIAKYIYMFFISNSVMMFASAAFSVTSILLTPTIRAIFSKLVKPNEVGAVFSGIAVIEQLCGLVGSLIFNPIYASTQKAGHPSVVYLVCAGIYTIGGTILIVYAVLTRHEGKPKPASSQPHSVDT